MIIHLRKLSSTQRCSEKVTNGALAAVCRECAVAYHEECLPQDSAFFDVLSQESWFCADCDPGEQVRCAVFVP